MVNFMVLLLKAKKILFIIFIGVFLFLQAGDSLCFAKTGASIYYNNAYSVKVLPDKGILQGSISETKDIPAGLYGMWSVYSTIIQTNDYSSFNNKGSDIWSFAKDNDVITLTNPISGATASITVNEVHGNTAVFSRQTVTKNYKETEVAKITVEGDFFSGSDRIIVENFNKDKYIHPSVVEYKLRGTRLSGPTLRNIFGK